MDITSEIDQIKGATPPEKKWLKDPFAGRARILSVICSEDETFNGSKYTGKPYFKFHYRTETRELGNLMFWREIKGDDNQKNLDKRNKLKKFLDDCGADVNLKGLDYLKSVENKIVKVVIKKIEEFLTEKGTGRPMITAKLTYSYSCKEDQDLNPPSLNDMFIPIPEKDRLAFEQALIVWNQQNPKTPEEPEKQPGTESTSTEPKPESKPEGDDNLPF